MQSNPFDLFSVFLRDIFLSFISDILNFLQGFKTKNGYIVVAAGNDKQFVKVCHVRLSHTCARRHAHRHTTHTHRYEFLYMQSELE